MLNFLTKYQWHCFSLFYWACSLFILFYFNGTGGEADSINHYLHAQYAPQHLELYLNHWAKPVFTLLASPFAQFGFTGIQFFNILCTFGASYFTYKIAQQQAFRFPVLASLFYFVFPISFVTTFSGLTEPLCAFILTWVIFLFHNKSYLSAAFLVSFTPFIRSEGLLFLGVFALFFITKKEWKVLFTLAFGHLFYTLIGTFYYQDILWVFTKIPYAYLSSHYGSGSLFHFAEKLNYLMGIPLLIFFCLGFLRIIITLRKQTISLLLISTLFLVFFIAHTLFWYLEIFNSLGLKRVFAAVTPLMAILALTGINLLEKIQIKTIRISLYSIIILLILFFPFTKNPAAMDWEDLNLTEAQQNAKEVKDYLESNNIEGERYVYTDPYLSEVLSIDPFDFRVFQTLALNEAPIPLKQIILIENFQFKYIDENSIERRIVNPEFHKNDIVIWDNWHSVVDYGVNDEHLQSLKLNLLATFEKGKSTYKIYQP